MTTSSAKRPNFFVLLDLNPDAPWDDKVFEATLRKKQNDWSRDRNKPGAKGTEAKQNLALIAEIRRVMADPGLRRIEIEAARIEGLAKHKARIDTFEKQLLLATSKGYLEEDELTAFIAEFSDVLSEKEIRSRIKVSVRPPITDTEVEEEQLDQSIADGISSKLALLHLSTLYELFGLSNVTSSPVLNSKAEALYNEMVRRQPKTAEVDLKKELAGQAKTIFGSEAMRKKYDETLRQSTLAPLLKDLDDTMNRTVEKTLRAEQVDAFLQAAHKTGWDEARALAKLKKHVASHTWSMETPKVERDARQRCIRCNELNEKGHNYCWNCNAPLFVLCPNCGYKVPSDLTSCTQCSFLAGNYSYVDSLIIECERALKRQDLENAQQQLEEAEAAWKPEAQRGPWNPVHPDQLLESIRHHRSEIQARIKERIDTLRELYTLMKEKKFAGAGKFLDSHLEIVEDREKYQLIINNGKKDAWEEYKKASKPGISDDLKREYCRKALRICADYEPAKKLLGTMPPPSPPSHLKAEKLADAGEASVVLSWTPSTSRGVKYVIVRNTETKPESVKDGTVLDTVRETYYKDTNPETGVDLYYAVYTTDAGVYSLKGVVLSTPIIIPKGVSDVTINESGDYVVITWKVPPNVNDVVVVRKKGSEPRSTSDGVKIRVENKKLIKDNGPDQESTYYYAIYCDYSVLDRDEWPVKMIKFRRKA